VVMIGNQRFLLALASVRWCARRANATASG
jgi:hypothetical protein